MAQMKKVLKAGTQCEEERGMDRLELSVLLLGLTAQKQSVGSRLLSWR